MVVFAAAVGGIRGINSDATTDLWRKLGNFDATLSNPVQGGFFDHGDPNLDATRDTIDYESVQDFVQEYINKYK